MKRCARMSRLLFILSGLALFALASPAFSQDAAGHGLKPERSLSGMTAVSPPPITPGEPEAHASAVPATAPLVPAGASTLGTNGISFAGYVEYQVSGSFARMTAPQVSNNSSTRTTGTLRMNLWFSEGGYRQFGYSTAKYTLGTLLPNYYFYSIDSGWVAFSVPPTGCYYVSILLEEYQSTGTWEYVDYIDTDPAPVAINGGCASCTTTATSACLLNRFQASVRYRGAFDNGSADTTARLKAVTGFASSSYETCFFYFNSANNIELMLKMLDQGNTNASGSPTIAVLFGSATPLRTELTIVDTWTGTTRRYTSEFGGMRGTTDFTAFVK